MGLGMIIAGGLQGLGKGIADKGAADMAAATKREESEAEYRRTLALEGLRQENDLERIGVSSDYADRNAARQTARDVDAKIITSKTEAELQAERDARLHGQDKEKIALAQAHDERMAQVRANLDVAKLEAQQAIESGNIQDSVIDGKTGEIVFITKGGKKVRSGITATDREIYGSSTASAPGGSVIDRARGGAVPPRTPPAVEFKFNPETGELEQVRGR